MYINISITALKLNTMWKATKSSKLYMSASSIRGVLAWDNNYVDMSHININSISRWSVKGCFRTTRRRTVEEEYIAS